MTINTDYDIGDEFFHINNSKIIKRRVKRVKIEIYRPSNNSQKNIVTSINYISTDLNGCSELQVKSKSMYRTKQEAGDAWMKEQGLKGSKS